MIITIPTVNEEWEDMVYPYLAFCYKMKFQNREWTGYKELKEIGLDPDWLISLGILFDPTPTGTYRFIPENIPNLVNIYAKGKPELCDTTNELWTTEFSKELKWDDLKTFALGYYGGITLYTPPKDVNPELWANNDTIALILQLKLPRYVISDQTNKEKD